MQLTGGRFTLAAALAGNDLATFPDFPAEIRAPAGTTFGVSAYQINFGARVIKTSGDMVDLLIAMNPAALKVNLDDVRSGGLVIVDAGAFTEKNLRKAGYDKDPRDDGSLSGYRFVEIDMSQLTSDAVKAAKLSKKEALRCKNMWALGLAYWLFDRDRQSTVDWLDQKFLSRPELAAGNIAALNAGHAFGETTEMSGASSAFIVRPAEIAAGNIAALNAGHAFGETTEMSGASSAFIVRPAEIAPGLYRNVTGTDALAWGLIAGAALAELKLVFCSYPITPASGVLHALAGLKDYGVTTRACRSRPRASISPSPPSSRSSWSTRSAPGPRPGCRPRPNRPTSIRRCSGATATARSSCSPPARRPIAMMRRSPPCAWRPSS
jgi:2-oxoglutarate ferredoxin oxidoreductase subunit alpha